MSSANAFVSHAINIAFIPRPVPLHYIVDGKKINILAFLKGITIKAACVPLWY